MQLKDIIEAITLDVVLESIGVLFCIALIMYFFLGGDGLTSIIEFFGTSIFG